MIMIGLRPLTHTISSRMARLLRCFYYYIHSESSAARQTHKKQQHNKAEFNISEMKLQINVPSITVLFASIFTEKLWNYALIKGLWLGHYSFKAKSGLRKEIATKYPT